MMRISSAESFLVIEAKGSSDATVRILGSQSEAIGNWDSSTRISPIFLVEGIGNGSNSFPGFRGKSTLLFLGPLNPERLLPHGRKITRLWLSLGLLNVVIQANETNSLAIARWAKEQSIAHEGWNLSGEKITSFTYWVPPEVTEPWRNELALTADTTCPPELREALHEYAPLLAATLSRSCILPSAYLTEVLRMHGEVEDMVKNAQVQQQPTTTYEALGELFTFNAALSRYSSQTFAGTPPVFNKECHLWSHSLLGIGVATIAIRNLRHFFEKTLGEWRLVDRFSGLRSVPTNGLSLQTARAPENLLAAVQIDVDSLNRDEPLIPLLTYFSGRDGYRSTGMTISAPLAAIGACNSTRWSLLTLTHELSHVIIRAVLSELLPDLNNQTSLHRWIQLVDQPSPPDNFLDALRRNMVFTLLSIDDAAAGRSVSPSIGVDELKLLIRRWRHDVDEILVHAFDYLYFYGRNLQRYISGIWASWGAIPNISTRVPDYVVRSICTAMTTTLSRGPDASRLAKDAVVNLLIELRDTGHGGRYVDEAIDCINRQWDADIKEKVESRCELIWMASTVLFSQAAATAVRGETEIVGGENDTEGYPHRIGVLDLRPIENPLRFIEIFTTSRDPSPSLSLWLLHVLAFSYQDG